MATVGKVLTKKQSELVGIPEMLKRIDRISKRMATGVKSVYRRAAMVVRDEARDLVPVRTGRLKRSIFAGGGDPTKSNALVGVNQNAKRGGAPYGHIIEFGSSTRDAHPFMRPAIRAARPTAAKIIAEGLQKAIEEEAAK